MSSKQTIAKFLLPLTITLGLLFTIWIRTPFLREGSPYLYREDEAHHFNRIVNMMKSGDLNPHYFHKPSLHFYLRLPVVSAAFLWAVKKGELNKLNDIVTSDPFGIADYSFSVSHPRLLLASRAFSILLQLGSIFLTFIICARLMGGIWLPCFAALLFIFSPAAISESGVIGVDGVMTFFCLATVYLGLRANELKTTLALFWCALAAGLAVSSKYNALPIMIVPILVFLIQRPLNLERGLIAVLLPWVSFLAASPFIILSLPEFLNQLGYEVWHYGVAGHIGHMAEPGFSQAKFYISWIAHDGLGLMAASLAFCGVIFVLLKMGRPDLKIAAAFPILFFALMVAQKANFERNMVVIIPFAAMFSALALSYMKKALPVKILYAIALISLIQPFISALEVRAKTESIPESRLAAASQIQNLSRQGQELALDGRLQFIRHLLEEPGVSRTDFSNASPLKAFQEGYDYLVIRPSDKSRMLDNDLFESAFHYDGVNESQRIIQNPAIEILKRKIPLDLAKITAIAKGTAPLTLTFPNAQSEFSFPKELEPQLWLQKSIQTLLIKTSNNEALPQSLHLSLFSPWPNQALTFYVNTKTLDLDMSGKVLAEIDIPLDPSQKEQLIIVKSAKVHSPKALGISIDARRLAVAIKSASIR